MLQALAASSQTHGEAFAEVSATAASGQWAPLWLSSNRQGTVAVTRRSAYERLGASLSTILGHTADTARQWHVEAGADVLLAQGDEYDFFVHQLYASLTWRKATLTIGQREREIDLRNNLLTSGGLSQGINAQPLPEVLLSVDYFSVPATRGWWKIRGRIGYGRTTDGAWQEQFVGVESGRRYTSNTLYHEKAMYWRFGREEHFPLTFEIGLQMMTQFGGTTYNATGRNYDDASVPMRHPENLSAFWHALWPVGSFDPTDGVNPNSAGNTFGSYNMAATWHGRGWQCRAYFERMFEDQSMLTTQYGIYDHLLGLDIALPKNPYVSAVAIEHLSTTDQAGPLYHDATHNMPESYTGRDNYYNHGLYTGWQNWGRAMGTPLLTSPIYNSGHELRFQNNRVRAWHVGLTGSPAQWITWRALATWTTNRGTYDVPFADIVKQQHYLAEATATPQFARDWRLTLAVGLDHGSLLGNSLGFTMTLRRTLNLH